jgi:TusA-related sulfurtransferase
MANKNDSQSKPMRFGSILQRDVPKGRDGKHKTIVKQLLNDLEKLESGSALKIPLADLPDTKENIRSALNRATRQRGMEVATSSDAEYLYVWNVDPPTQEVKAALFR